MSLTREYMELVKEMEEESEVEIEKIRKEADQFKETQREECMEASELTDIELKEKHVFKKHLEMVFNHGFESGLEKGFELGRDSEYIKKMKETLKKQQEIINKLQDKLDEEMFSKTGEQREPDYIS